MNLRTILLAGAIGLVPMTGEAVVVLNFSDPLNDSTGSVDATGMTMTIDENNGDYSIDITASAADPFLGAFRININVFNATLDEFFQDAFNDFNEPAPLTILTLTGNDADLTDWLDSHAIATSTLDGLGNPAGSSFFRTSVADLPFQSICVAEDVIGSVNCNPPANAPAPMPLALLLPGVLGVFFVTRRKTRAGSH